MAGDCYRVLSEKKKKLLGVAPKQKHTLNYPMEVEVILHTVDWKAYKEGFWVLEI